MEKLGFMKSEVDQAVFYRRDEGWKILTIMLVHVDDCLIVASSQPLISRFKSNYNNPRGYKQGPLKRSGRLFHEDYFLFSEFAIQICALDVNLTCFQVLCSCKCKNGSDGSKPSDWCKCVEVVDTRYLPKPLSNQLSFISDHISSSILFHPKNPLQTHYICSLWCVYQFPSSCCL